MEESGGGGGGDVEAEGSVLEAIGLGDEGPGDVVLAKVPWYRRQTEPEERSGQTIWDPERVALKTELELAGEVPARISWVSVTPSPSASVPQICSTHSGRSTKGFRLDW